MSFGGPPVARSLTGTPLLGLHALRGGRGALSRLFSSMQSESNVQVGGGRIGVLWAGRPRRRDDTVYVLGDVVTVATAPALNSARLFACVTPGRSAAAEPAEYGTAADGVTIQDGGAAFRAIRVAFNNNPLLVVVSSFPAGRAVNIARTITSRSAPGPGPTRSRSRRARWASFSISMRPTSPTMSPLIPAGPSRTKSVTHSAWGMNTSEADRSFPGTEDDLDHDLNLQTETDTQVNGQIDALHIRWNWHRIRKAAVISAAITPVSPGAYKIPVVPGQAWQFHKDDTVLLRHRVPGEFLGAAYVVNSQVSPALQIAVAPTSAAANDFLLVQAAAGATVTDAAMAAFLPGSIVFLPVPAPSSVRTAAYPYAEMIAKNIGT